MKLTRKSYKRKIIALGVAAFISLSLIATGFAAWVLAATAEKDAENNVTVGTTKDCAIEIGDFSFSDGIKDFAFEPKEDDESGRVQNDGEAFESLSIEVICTINKISFVELITVNFELPAGVQAAVDAGYIKAPEIVATPIEITTPNADSSVDGYWSYDFDESADSATLSVKLTFDWGEKFGNMNPGYYYDTDPVGKDVAFDAMKRELDTFKATVYGISYDEYQNLGDDARDELTAPKYKLLISASA